MIKEMLGDLLTAATEETTEETRLREHVEDAQLLLTYAAEAGLHIEQELVRDIVSSRFHLQNSSFDQEKEIQFWTAFDALSQKIQPVCIESIKATRVRRKRAWRFKLLELLLPVKRSEAAHTVRVYQCMTLFALGVLLIVQIYWLVGSVIITQVTQKESFQEEISQLTALIEKAKEMNSDDLGKLTGDIRSKYENKASDTNSSSIVYYKSLREWRSNMFTSWIFNQQPDEPSQADEDELPQTDQDKYAELGYIEARQAAQLILQPIQQYILPLLYGWIGALAYVLRSINREIKEITYTSQSKEHYRLRTQLGALSGLAVGWFLSVDPEHYATQSSYSFGSLSPLALSFLAGYSVELLFSAMDKLVEAFSSSPQK